jgi:hypothetical protein
MEITIGVAVRVLVVMAFVGGLGFLIDRSQNRSRRDIDNR